MVFNDIRDTLMAAPHHGEGYATSDIFTVRHQLIAELDPQPRSVFEFGALLGYFLLTAIDAAPTVTDVGWVDNQAHTPNSNLLCEANLADYSYRHHRHVNRQHWTDTPDSVRFGQADLVQVDADHSYPACLTDLIWALELKPRTIMVDDYTAHPAVKAATRTFANMCGLEVEEHVTVNGLAVLKFP